MEPDRSSMRSSQSEGPQIIAHYDQNGHRISRNSFRDSLLDSLIQHATMQNIHVEVPQSIIDDLQSARNSFVQSIMFVNQISQDQLDKHKKALFQSTYSRQSNQSLSPQNNRARQSNRESNQSIQNFIPKSTIVQPMAQVQKVHILLILTATQPINDIYIVDSEKNIGKLKCSQQYQFNNKYMKASIFSVSLTEIVHYSIRYETQKTTMLFFSNTFNQQISLKDVMIESKAGIFCNQIIQGKDPQLINFCLFQAHQYLIKRIQYLRQQNPQLLHEFYSIIKGQYILNCQNQATIFRKLTIDDSKCRLSQYFLYLFYSLYRQNASNRLKQFKLLQKLHFNSKSIPHILRYKRYQQFQNGLCFKDFLLFTIMQYAYIQFHEHYKSLRGISKYCILQLNKIRGKQIFDMLADHPIMSYLLQNQSNLKMIVNEEIGFTEYFQVLFKVTQIKVNNHQQMCKDKTLTDILVSMLKKCNSKAEIVKPENKDSQLFKKYNKRIHNLIYNNYYRLTLDTQRIGQVYLQLKFLLYLVRPLGQVFLDVLRKDITENIPLLLKHNFLTIIYPMILLPQLKEQNSTLYNHFVEERIPTDDIIHLIKIMTEKSNRFYNYLTVKYVLVKYVALNPYWKELNLSRLKETVEEALRLNRIQLNNKRIFVQFCNEIIQKLRESGEDSHFISWWKEKQENFI